MSWVATEAIVVRGYGVASGKGADARFPQGTLALQKPRFKARGLDLEAYHPATLNLSVRPQRYVILKSRHTFRGVKWHPDVPAEDFSFFDCRVRTADGTTYPGLVYLPHPETKPQHHHPPDVLEVITTYIAGVKPGDQLTLELDGDQLELT